MATEDVCSTTYVGSPAESFEVWEFIVEELRARDLSVAEFEARLGLPIAVGLVAGSVRVDDDVAAALSRAFGTSPELWFRLQALADSSSDQR